MVFIQLHMHIAATLPSLHNHCAVERHFSLLEKQTQVDCVCRCFFCASQATDYATASEINLIHCKLLGVVSEGSTARHTMNA